MKSGSKIVIVITRTGLLRNTIINKHFLGFRPDYKFDIKRLFEQGHVLTKQNIFLLSRAILMIVSVNIITILVFLDAYGINDINKLMLGEETLSVGQQVFMDISLTLLVAPLWTGISMAALLHLKGMQVSFSAVFTYFKMLPVLALAYLITNTLFEFGLMLLVVPGFYIFTATTFTLMLIADKGLSPIKAIGLSIKAVNHYLGSMLSLYACFLLSLVLIVFTFGIAYFYIGPLYFNVKAIIYQDLFIERDDTNNIDKVSKQGVFNA